MTFPANWPPAAAKTNRSLRFCIVDTATADFADKAYLFADQTGADPEPTLRPAGSVGYVPPADAYSVGIIIANDSTPGTGADLQYSFDGTNVAGVVKAGELHAYDYRHEAGICFQGAGAIFRVIAW